MVRAALRAAMIPTVNGMMTVGLRLRTCEQTCTHGCNTPVIL
jgi:hypothetical protein